MKSWTKKDVKDFKKLIKDKVPFRVIGIKLSRSLSSLKNKKYKINGI